MLCVGAMIVRLRLNLSTSEAEPRNTHFQPEAGNEIEKGFELTAVFTYLNHIYRREHRQSFGTYNNFTDAVPLQRGLFT